MGLRTGLLRTGGAALVCAAVGLCGCATNSQAVASAVSSASTCGVDVPAQTTSDDGFGCATSAILLEMLVNPEDLTAPAPLPYPQGDAAIAPAQRHRAGKVKSLSGSLESSSNAEDSAEGAEQ